VTCSFILTFRENLLSSELARMDGREARNSGRMKRFCFLFETSRSAAWFSQPSVKWVRRFFNWGGGRMGGDVDHSPPFRGVVKNEWRYTSAAPICFYGVGRGNLELRNVAMLSENAVMPISYNGWSLN
jgi:hypothetical protein